MRVLPFIVALSIGELACNQKKQIAEEQYETQHVTFTSEEEEPEPPPPGFSSTYKSIGEWLTGLCSNDKPDKPISKYSFSLFEGEDNYTLCLIGTNTYEISKDHAATRIEFSPTDMYFSLPASEYRGLKREQVLDRLTHHLKDFISSDKFKSSFFSEAKSIEASWKGEIWKK